MNVITLKKTEEKIVATVINMPDGLATQQTTIPYFYPDNPKHVLHVQLNQQYLLIKKYGCPTIGFNVGDLVDLALDSEPKLKPQTPK